MDRAEIKKKLTGAKYFRDEEGKLKIIKIYEDTFLAEDADGVRYELFYVDYEFNRQKFEIIR